MKSLFITKTFWYNVLSALGLILALPELTSLVGVNGLRYVVLLGAIINVLLRWMTTEPVRIMGEMK
jgi:hypothetical protein